MREYRITFLMEVKDEATDAINVYETVASDGGIEDVAAYAAGVAIIEGQRVIRVRTIEDHGEIRVI